MSWKDKRKAKKLAKGDFFDKEEDRLSKLLAEVDPKEDRETYETLKKDLKETINMRSESRESKRRISKEAKGNLLIKTVGGIIGALGLGGILWAEHKGMVFTGEKRSMVDSISRTIGNIFWPRG